MKHVDIEEFYGHASDFLASGETVTIVRDGKAMGVFVPSEEIRRARLNEALDRLGETVQQILNRTGMTEDEFVRLFDLNQPLPDEPFPARGLATVTTDASGHRRQYRCRGGTSRSRARTQLRAMISTSRSPVRHGQRRNMSCAGASP